jgi:hypothetical protein
MRQLVLVSYLCSAVILALFSLCTVALIAINVTISLINNAIILKLVGICWDQWFPECARAMTLQGAEILFYPTAIGSEPQDGNLDSREHWKRVMQGHAGANLVLFVVLYSS